MINARAELPFIPQKFPITVI